MTGGTTLGGLHDIHLVRAFMRFLWESLDPRPCLWLHFGRAVPVSVGGRRGDPHKHAFSPRTDGQRTSAIAITYPRFNGLHHSLLQLNLFVCNSVIPVEDG